VRTRRTTPLAAVPIVVFLFTWTLTTHGKYSVSGDEPHYLIISESLRTDWDLDLANNYAQDDARLFGRAGLEVEVHALPSRTGELRSVHTVGLPIVLLPAYVAAQHIAGATPESLLKRFRMDRGLFAYSLVGLFLIALTAFGFTLLAAGLATSVGPRLASALAIAAGVSPPVVSHAFLVFPDTVALFVTCCAVWFATKHSSSRDSRTLQVLLVLLGLTPWLHQKYLVYVPGLVFAIGWARRDLVGRLRPRAIAAGLALLGAPQVALLAWSQYEWGTFGGAITTGALTSAASPFSLGGLWSGAVGLWVDRQSGFLAFAPAYWIVPACWWLSWRRVWWYSGPIVLLYVPAAAFVIGWWAGFSPAARYLTPAIPLLLVPVGLSLRYRSVRLAAATLLIAQAAIDAVIWQRPRWLWPSATGDNPALQALGWPGRLYERLLPAVRLEGLSGALPVFIVLCLVTAIVVAVASRERRLTDAMTPR
jgi:hypothetical protein